MYKTTLALGLFILLGLFSCKKDDEVKKDPPDNSLNLPNTHFSLTSHDSSFVKSGHALFDMNISSDSVLLIDLSERIINPDEFLLLSLVDLDGRIWEKDSFSSSAMTNPNQAYAFLTYEELVLSNGEYEFQSFPIDHVQVVITHRIKGMEMHADFQFSIKYPTAADSLWVTGSFEAKNWSR